MSEPRFNDLIHSPTRLSIVAMLAATEWADFTFVRDELVLSESALSKQLSTLEAAGYLQTRKRKVGKYPRTSTRLTPAGRRAFAEHVAALQQLLRIPAQLEDVNEGVARST
jgi:DNA-binding MarR family transcriptional regulator